LSAEARPVLAGLFVYRRSSGIALLRSRVESDLPIGQRCAGQTFDTRALRSVPLCVKLF